MTTVNPEPMGNSNPLQVTPLLLSQSRDAQTFTLISMERWDTHLAMNVELAQPLSRNASAQVVAPTIGLTMTDGAGTLYKSSSSGGGSGGGWDNRLISYTRVRFTPVPMPGANLVFRATAHYREVTRISTPGNSSLTGQEVTEEVKTWDDPTPWELPVIMPEWLDQATYLTGHSVAPPPVSMRHTRLRLPDISKRRSIIPVLQSRRLAGSTITLLAIEVGMEGCLFDCRIQQEAELFHDPLIRCAVRDDRGNVYAIWPGAGNGEPAASGSEWRLSFSATPPLDPEASTLFVAIEEPQRNIGNRFRQFGLLDMEHESDQWLFSIPLK